MLLSTKGRYAVMAMVELARRGEGAKATLADIAESQEIPLGYLEQIFRRLRQEALVSAVRGPGGGYRLEKPAEEMSVSEIILASDEAIEIMRCGGAEKGGCMSRSTKCLTHDLWDGLGQQIHIYLEAVKLSDVCAGEVKNVKVSEPRLAPGDFYDFIGVKETA